MSFASASAVSRLGNGSWSADAAPDWDIFGVTNGGYLMAIAARAMSGEAGGRHPASVSAHFTRPTSPGPLTIEVATIKEGRSLSTMRSEMRNGSGLLLSATGTFADPERPIPDVELAEAKPPAVPPPDECDRVLPAHDAPLPPPIMAQYDLRLHPEDATALLRAPSGTALIRGWFHLLDEEPVDPFLPLLVADAFPPAVFNANLPLAWTPTVEMTTQVRSVPSDGWLLCQFRTRFVSGGFLEEDGEIWDADGRLVALSRQLALVPR